MTVCIRANNQFFEIDENRDTTNDRWFEARDSSVDILVLGHAQNTSSVKEMTSSFRSILQKEHAK